MARLSNGPSPLAALPGDPGAYLYEAVEVLEQRLPAGRFAVALSGLRRRAGTSSLAWHFALALASAGERAVCLVEANFRSPVLARALGVDAAPGFGELLGGGAGMDEVIRDVPGHEVRVVTAGGRRPGPALLDREALARGVKLLRERFEAVIFDTAPLLQYPDTLALARHLDGTVFVLYAERDKWEAAQRGMRVLEGSGARAVGAVLNRKPLYIPKWVYRLL